jgi:glycerate 2-kinase
MMRILIAPNAFKNSLNADAAARAIKAGLGESKLKCDCVCFPIGDGGDGTGELIIKHCRGTIIPSSVMDPLGRKIDTWFGVIDEGKTAVIEMANASGLRLLSKDELNPSIASSFGTGEQLAFAVGLGVQKVIIAMGGSATVDGGTGMLRALGVKFLDTQGKELLTPQSLVNLSHVDRSTIDPRILNCEIIILCDVDNPLLGDQGAAQVFGPQKGASIDDVNGLERSLQKMSQVTSQITGRDMSKLAFGGTAGGAAAGLSAYANATLVNGIEYFKTLTGFNEALDRADLLITGEGSIDEQTLSGKAPFGVASAAKAKNIPVIAFAGKVPVVKSMALNRYLMFSFRSDISHKISP